MRTLSSTELKWFHKYIHSPFFNSNDKTKLLLEIIRKYHPEYDNRKLGMEHIGPILLGPEWQVKDVRYAMTELYELLEKYLIYTEFSKNKMYQSHLLLQAYEQRNLHKQFQTELRKAVNSQLEQPYRDVEFYFHQHLIESDTYLHSLTRNPRAINTSLQDAVDNLDYYYLANRLRFSAAMLNREEILQEKYNNLFLSEILDLLSKLDLDNMPSIGIYHRIVLLFLEPDNPAHYARLIEQMEEHGALFPADEQYDMYMHALNYCNRRLSAGHLEYQQEMLKLYKILLRRGIIMDDAGQLSPSTFKNIMTLALRVGQLDYARDFLEEYQTRVDAIYRDSTVAYNMANLLFAERAFGKALRQLLTVDLQDIYYHLDAKVLLLKTYYEVNDYEPFMSLTESFANYLKRNRQISDTQREIYLNFVKYVRKLMQIRHGKKISVHKLGAELKETGMVANMSWLLEKINEYGEQE